MKLIDDRIQKEEVADLSEELVSVLTQALDEDYAVHIDSNQENHLRAEFRKVLAKFFSVK